MLPVVLRPGGRRVESSDQQPADSTYDWREIGEQANSYKPNGFDQTLIPERARRIAILRVRPRHAGQSKRLLKLP